MSERRTDRRVMCKECRGEHLCSESDRRSIIIYYTDMSAHGVGCFFVGDEPLIIGGTYHVVRHDFQRVFYKVCWCERGAKTQEQTGESAIESDTFHAGLKVLDTGTSCEDIPNNLLSLRKAKYASRNRKSFQVGVS